MTLDQAEYLADLLAKKKVLEEERSLLHRIGHTKLGVYEVALSLVGEKITQIEHEAGILPR